MKRALFALLALIILAAGSVSAQSKTSLNIQSNQTGAQVFINDRLVGYTNPGFSFLVQPGRYDIRVTKEGYPDFKTSVSVGSSPVTVIANLGPGGPPNPPTTIPLPPPPPPRATLSVTANAPGAQVWINGSFAGNAPFSTSLPPGSYTLSVRADGYSEFRQDIVVNGPVRITASLYPLGYEVYIDSPGIHSAEVYRNSTWVGTTPYRDTWAPGYYTVTVRAPGYNDFYNNFTLSAPKHLQANLQSSTVPYEIHLPEALSERDSKGPKWKQFKIYIDNNPVYSTYGSIVPGRHTFTLELGGISFDSTFQVTQGKPCVIEPGFTVTVTQ
ncbi:MAG: PEGA domain-containing protein [Rectinemataceae bacterium]|nr:PEGA domain-containing protein [Rectinemataceae bacterium]